MHKRHVKTNKLNPNPYIMIEKFGLEIFKLIIIKDKFLQNKINILLLKNIILYISFIFYFVISLILYVRF